MTLRKVQRVVVDTETTGLGHVAKPPREDAIVQLAFAWRDPRSGLLASRAWDCRPEASMMTFGRADEAFRIQGRTVRDILAARPASAVALEAHALLKSLGDPLLSSYNIAFDKPFLSAGPWNLGDRAWGSCIMLRATPACQACDGTGTDKQLYGCRACYGSGRERWPKLRVAAERLKIPFDESKLHGAEADARLALLVDEALDHQGEVMARGL